MSEQENISRAFWEQVALDSSRNPIPGLLETDPILSTYRNSAEQHLFFQKINTLLQDRHHLLEVGCGGGRWTVTLASHFERILASDISEQMVNYAKKYCVQRGLSNVNFQICSADNLQLAGQEFDTIYLGSCLHYMSDEAIVKMLSHLAQHTTSTSLMISRDTVSLLGKAFYRSEYYTNSDPAIYRPAEFYQEAMLEHGWVLKDSWPTYFKSIAWPMRKFVPRTLLLRVMRMEAQLMTMRLNLYQVKNHLWKNRHNKEHRFFVYEKQQ